MRRKLGAGWVRSKGVNQLVVAESKRGNGNGMNDDRVAFALDVLEQMAAEVESGRLTGTIGVEIPVKDGQLGKVKRVQILYQED